MTSTIPRDYLEHGPMAGNDPVSDAQQSEPGVLLEFGILAVLLPRLIVVQVRCTLEHITWE